VLRRRLAGLTPIVTSLKIRVETGDSKGDIKVQNDSDEDHTLDARRRLRVAIGWSSCLSLGPFLLFLYTRRIAIRSILVLEIAVDPVVTEIAVRSTGRGKRNVRTCTDHAFSTSTSSALPYLFHRSPSACLLYSVPHSHSFDLPPFFTRLRLSRRPSLHHARVQTTGQQQW
jgi:hypothetical protein